MAYWESTGNSKLDELCKKHNVKWNKYAPDANFSSANPRTREITLAPVENERAYLVAMHELGHIICGHTIPEKDILKTEAEAWLWALEHCGDWPRPSVEEFIIDAWSSYIAGCNVGDFPKPYGENSEEVLKFLGLVNALDKLKELK